jgi:hypothetical protein
MKGRGFHNPGLVHVAEREHVVEAVFPPGFVTAVAAEPRRIPEGPKDHVPDWQVREVVGVMTELVMNTMRFRSLENVADPSRSLNIPVIEKFSDGDEQGVIAGGLNIAAEERIDDQTADDGVQPDLHRVLVETRQDFEPARRMVNLVQGAPKKLRFVAIPMPPVKDEGREGVDDNGRRPGWHLVTQVKERRAIEPSVPCRAGEHGDSKLNPVDQEDPRPPSPDAWQFHGRPESLCGDTSGRDGKD